jgi:hypothetical protein
MKNFFYRGIKGRVRYRACGHGVIFIDDFKETGNICETCNPIIEKMETFNLENTQEFFNHGLGCVTYGTRDAEKKAKKMGLIPIGDSSIQQVFGR